jgi:aarF domain-containing kinase
MLETPLTSILSQVDDLAYLAQHHIDRNRVAQEIQRIFSQMVYINGFFHAGTGII